MKDVNEFSSRRKLSLADRPVARFDVSGNPLKMRFRDSIVEKISPLSIVPKTENISNETQTRVRKILSVFSPNCQVQRQESGGIIHLSPARMNVGGISEKAYNRRHGLQESGVHRFFRKNVKEPLGRGFMRAGDFFVKAYGQSYLDRFDILRLKFSDKNNNYSRGMLSKFTRTPLSLLGTPAMGNIPSLLLNKTLMGQGIKKYRERRRGRVDKMKERSFLPFRRGATTISSKLPLHESRYKLTQKMRGVNEWISRGEQYAKSLIDGGMSGVLLRRKQKKEFRERDARLKETSNIPKGRETVVKEPFLSKKNGVILRTEFPKKRTLKEKTEEEEIQFPLAA